MSSIKLDIQMVDDELKSAAREILPKAGAALRDLQEKRCTGAEFTGWYDWPKIKGHALAKDIRKLVGSLDVFYDQVVVIGIGGSYLGCRAVTDALSHSYAGQVTAKQGRRPGLTFAGHHLSESGLVELLDLLEEKQPIINVISKSGTTTEPAVAFRVIRSYMEKRFGKEEASKRIIATTDSKSGALRSMAKSEGFKSFDVPGDVGGRYSVLTAVGLVPLALAGFNIEDLLQGADDVFRSLEAPAADHPVLQYAAVRSAAYQNGKTVDILAYGEPRLFHTVEWWKQLFGESEGKEGKGLFPAGVAYTTDLHSLGQYVQEGVRNLIETFLMVDDPLGRTGGVERRLRIPAMSENADELRYLENRFISEINDAALVATRIAHFDGGVPCMALHLPRIDEKSLGALFAFFETACAIGGALLQVNPFDQPGVEAYKKNLFGLLGKPGFENLGVELRRRL